MTKKDDKAAATKGDLSKVKHELKADMHNLKTEILEEIKSHFDLAVENIRHDLLGANRDEIEAVKDRVTHLEVHTGLARR